VNSPSFCDAPQMPGKRPVQSHRTSQKNGAEEFFVSNGQLLRPLFLLPRPESGSRATSAASSGRTARVATWARSRQPRSSSATASTAARQKGAEEKGQLPLSVLSISVTGPADQIPPPVKAELPLRVQLSSVSCAFTKPFLMQPPLPLL